jgi:hypothetical protein
MDVGADFYTVHVVCSCFLIRCWSIDTKTAGKVAKIGEEYQQRLSCTSLGRKIKTGETFMMLPRLKIINNYSSPVYYFSFTSSLEISLIQINLPLRFSHTAIYLPVYTTLPDASLVVILPVSVTVFSSPNTSITS